MLIPRELILKDEEVAKGAKVQDYHRQALLDAAHERYGVGHWFTLMHGDEIFHDDPRDIIEKAEKQGRIAKALFFLPGNR